MKPPIPNSDLGDTGGPVSATRGDPIRQPLRMLIVAGAPLLPHKFGCARLSDRHSIVAKTPAHDRNRRRVGKPIDLAKDQQLFARSS
jgi:hypothetical protein